MIQVVFRKMMFDNTHQNFADMRVTGALHSDGITLTGVWIVQLVGLDDHVLIEFPPATSEGTRMGCSAVTGCRLP